MLQTIKEEFLSELNNNTSVMCGSLFTREDVGQIIGIFAERLAAIEQPARATIDDAIITRLVEIAESAALDYAQNCAENYEFDDIEFNTNEYRGELTVTADVNVDTHSFARSATFNTNAARTVITELLNPNAQPNA
tara:strand:- start:4439 stop:4846 length:408 start_codon:yes stop_codon:yes gene_type:complete